MAVKPMTRTFATRFYDSPLYQAIKKEYDSASETEEKGWNDHVILIYRCYFKFREAYQAIQ